MNKKQRIILIVGIIFAVLLVAGGSYAFWMWSSNVNKNVAFNTANLEKYIVYDEGDAKFIGNFQPTTTFCESAHNTISFYKKVELQDMNVSASIKMQVNSIGENTSLSSDVYWVVTTGGNNIDCSGGLESSNVLAYGNFVGVTNGQELELYDDIEVMLTEQAYTVWIWIDSNGTNLSDLSGETIDTNIWTNFELLGAKEYVVTFDADGGNLDYSYIINKYSVSGNYSFSAPYTNDYQIELWGASGGGENSGAGGYTSGVLSLNEGDKLYFYIGGVGSSNATVTNVGGYNGGGYSGNNSGANSYGGGGATDVRLVAGEWNDLIGLRSRIMVAAGGAGTTSNLTTIAGGGGGLTGGSGTSSDSTYNNSSYLPIGSNQTGVGFTYGTTDRQGGFGYAIQSNTSGWGGGGGGGYYGGSNGHGTTGAGGSSFISGHTGCVAVVSSSSTTARVGTDSATCTTGTTDNLCSVHYSGISFKNTLMIDASGYSWLYAKSDKIIMPNPNGGNYSLGVGHKGNGVARISLKNSKLISYDELYGDLPIPVKIGYIFLGWYTEPEGGELITNKTKMQLHDNHTLYARWEIKI